MSLWFQKKKGKDIKTENGKLLRIYKALMVQTFPNNTKPNQKLFHRKYFFNRPVGIDFNHFIEINYFFGLFFRGNFRYPIFHFHWHRR